MTDTAGADLRTLLLADATLDLLVEGRIVENFIPSLTPLPYLWFNRASAEYLDCCTPDSTAPWRTFWDVEACADTVADAIAIADAVRAAVADWIANFPSNQNVIGNGVYSYLCVMDQSEEYDVRNASADAVIHVSTLRLELTHP